MPRQLRTRPAVRTTTPIRLAYASPLSPTVIPLGPGFPSPASIPISSLSFRVGVVPPLDAGFELLGVVYPPRPRRGVISQFVAGVALAFQLLLPLWIIGPQLPFEGRGESPLAGRGFVGQHAAPAVPLQTVFRFSTATELGRGLGESALATRLLIHAYPFLSFSSTDWAALFTTSVSRLSAACLSNPSLARFGPGSEPRGFVVTRISGGVTPGWILPYFSTGVLR